MRNFQAIIFIWTEKYRKIFKFAFEISNLWGQYPPKKNAFGFHILLFIRGIYISGQTSKVLVNISKKKSFLMFGYLIPIQNDY